MCVLSVTFFDLLNEMISPWRQNVGQVFLFSLNPSIFFICPSNVQQLREEDRRRSRRHLAGWLAPPWYNGAAAMVKAGFVQVGLVFAGRLVSGTPVPATAAVIQSFRLFGTSFLRPRPSNLGKGFRTYTFKKVQ